MTVGSVHPFTFQVTENQQWEDVVQDLKLPRACLNADQALKHIYIRYSFTPWITVSNRLFLYSELSQVMYICKRWIKTLISFPFVLMKALIMWTWYLVTLGFFFYKNHWFELWDPRLYQFFSYQKEKKIKKVPSLKKAFNFSWQTF